MRFGRKKSIDWESHEYKRARFHYLLQILYGESLSINFCSAMSEFAPTQEAKDFLLRQQREENKHLELLTDVVSKMERPPEKISPHMGKVHRFMERALAERDWPACILVQNVIAEGLALTLCEEQGEHGDETIRDVFRTIVKDEVHHVAFGVAELKKIVAGDTDGSVRRKLVGIHRRVLYHAVLLFKDLAPDADEIGLAWDDLAEKIMEAHLSRISEAGVHLPILDRLFLKGAVAFFVIL